VGRRRSSGQRQLLLTILLLLVFLLLLDIVAQTLLEEVVWRVTHTITRVAWVVSLEVLNACQLEVLAVHDEFLNFALFPLALANCGAAGLVRACPCVGMGSHAPDQILLREGQ